jgi:mRNA-degrading endonuclease toxin of MazEF toxin-antitoxin module
VPKPEQGRIVLVKVPDPQSRNAKTRPAVIVSWTEEIAVDGIIACVAITSAVPDKVPDDCILLPFSPGGKSRTGLKMRSAAMCSWLFQITEDDITKYIGMAPPQKLHEILACLEKRKHSDEHDDRE